MVACATPIEWQSSAYWAGSGRGGARGWRVGRGARGGSFGARARSGWRTCAGRSRRRARRALGRRTRGTLQRQRWDVQEQEQEQEAGGTHRGRARTCSSGRGARGRAWRRPAWCTRRRRARRSTRTCCRRPRPACCSSALARSGCSPAGTLQRTVHYEYLLTSRLFEHSILVERIHPTSIEAAAAL